MRIVKVNASTPYDIIIGNGLLENSGALCLDVLKKTCKICIVTDDTVAALYLDKVKASLNKGGFETVEFVFPHGETSKNTTTLVELVEFMAENRITRSDCVVALGGGVVGDMAGFAAATYMRGIRFIQMPTTLLSAVDSSVGGKTAVDLRAGKNLFGAFHQPSLVVCDCSTLNTLTDEIFADGCAEVIKYGIINDRTFFEKLSGGIKDQVEDVIAECVKNKAKIVENDEFENGCRKLLNLGHTIGHAIEICSELTISHGNAVAIGTVIVTRAAVKLGLCQQSELDLIIKTFKQESLPVSCEYSAEQLAKLATADKKRKGDSITLVVPYAIGDTRLLELPIDMLCDFIAKGL
jgi:3-dehydroquinate synthase